MQLLYLRGKKAFSGNLQGCWKQARCAFTSLLLTFHIPQN